MTTFTQAAARNATSAETLRVASGLSDDQWWAAAAPALEEVVNAGDYPLASRVGSTAGGARHSAHDADVAFEFGLARLVDGVVALLDE